MKALIVDESGVVSPRLHPALEEEGYCVESASTRGAARWLAAEAEADVVIVCSARPGAHDVPTIEALREDGEQAPILVLARRAESADTVSALDAGADDVVVSPVPFVEVAARLRALQRRPVELAAQDIEVGSLRLDARTHVAVRQSDDGDVPVELTQREFRMLEILMRHPGQVMSRTRLLEHVWGVEPEMSSNIVDQVVSHLRAKLDRPFHCADIATVRGVGYRFGGNRPLEPVIERVVEPVGGTLSAARSAGGRGPQQHPLR